MEEKQTIAACGAGTTTKVYFPAENRIERAENVKEVEQYIDRIDEMIVFHALTKDEIYQITGLLLGELQKRAREQLEITLKISPAVRNHISEKGFDEK